MPEYPKLRFEFRVPGGLFEVTGDLFEIQQYMEEIISVVKKMSDSLLLVDSVTPIQNSSIRKTLVASEPDSRVKEEDRISLRDYRKMSLRERLESLFNEGVFDKPVSAQQIRLELEARGVYHETRRIASELTRSFVQRNLIRRLGNRGTFSYVKA